jgi:hypothetical protein
MIVHVLRRSIEFASRWPDIGHDPSGRSGGAVSTHSARASANVDLNLHNSTHLRYRHLESENSQKSKMSRLNSLHTAAIGAVVDIIA